MPIAEGVALLAGSGTPPVGLRWHADYPMADTVDALGMILSAHRAMGLSTEVEPDWWIYQIVLDDLVVGDVGFHGPPALPGADVEIGYNVVPAFRGRGIATRAVGLVLQRAWRQGARAVRAETDANNVASRRVLLGSGFAALGDDRYVVSRPERP